MEDFRRAVTREEARSPKEERARVVDRVPALKSEPIIDRG